MVLECVGVMGYFSNSTDGTAYKGKWCANCAHFDDPCMVWGIHMMKNYEECNNEYSILHLLIPRSKDKLSNEKCTMFIKTSQKPREEAPYIPLKGEVMVMPCSTK
jgi:hypothetical protein